MSKLIELEQKDWLKLYVDHVVYNFSNKFDMEFKLEDIDAVCKEVADMNLPEGLDVYVAMLLLLPSVHNDYVHLDLAKLKAQGLTLGLDMLVYMYSQFCITDSYDEEIAYIFKQSLQYCIPF